MEDESGDDKDDENSVAFMCEISDLATSGVAIEDLLRGGAKLEIRSWGTHGKLQGCSSCLMTTSFVTNAVLIEFELLTFAPADLADYTIYGSQL